MKKATEDRLSPNDSVFFVAESASTPQVTALLTLLARTPDLARLKEAALRAAEALPRMRCVLDPRRFGVFAPVSRFDVDSHVTRVHAAEIMETVARLHSEPLAKDRPLWQFILISNRHPETGELPPCEVEQAAILWRIHHGLSDGIRSLGVFRTMLGNTAQSASNGHEAASEGWSPHSLRRAICAARIAARTQRMRSVPSPLNGVSSPARRITPVELDRTALRAIMRREGVGLHDVAVGILASALRQYHEHRGAQTVTDLRVIVPSNSRPLPNFGSRGNFVDMLWVTLPISEADPIRRLRRSAENLTRARGEGWVEFSRVMPPLIARAPLWVQRQSFSKASALTNAVCTIMPVNLHNLEMDGQSIGRSYAAATLLETHGAGFTFITTGATIRGAIVSDPNIVPDPDFLARALEAGLRELSG